MNRGSLWLPLAVSLASLPCFSDTGPEYLENETEQDPLSSGFILFQLPFEEKRDNLLHLRTFYQDRTLDGAPDREDWAGGGWVSAVGSYWQSRLKVAGTAYSSQKLYADDDKANTGALQKGHNSYSVLGEVYASLTLDDLAVQAGRYAINLPYVNKHDIRMTPQTFQGAQGIYRFNDTWSPGGGVLTHVKGRTRNGFDSMYKKAGLEEDENVYIAGSVSRKVLGLNPAEARGGVTGSMTSGAALSVVCDAAKSNVPALGYTGAYAFANVLLTLAGTLIMLI